MAAEFQKKIDKLIAKIMENSNIDYGNKASVRKYNRNQDWIRKNFGKDSSLTNEELAMLKSLITHPHPAVKADVCWVLICWYPLCFEFLRSCYQSLVGSLNCLSGDIKISYELGINFWKKQMIPLANKYSNDLELTPPVPTSSDN